ncbi:MAG TPA: sugar phosphate isomerase/epimerase [Bryobacteraceae bacterium]|jgi:sugar phosphate isomerase/epimerase
MKLGLFTALLSDLTLDDVISRVRALGIEAVEFATGNYGRPAHIQLDWIAQPSKLQELRKRLDDAGLIISALGCGGNVLHPDRKIGASHAAIMRQTILLAEALSVPNVINFSGCPGDCEMSKYPNFVTVAWPPDYLEILRWQWEAKVIPFWREEARFAQEHGVRIAIEMHPGFVAYSPETLLRLRAEAGSNIGCNFDPSHLFWQGIDPCLALRELGDAIFHVHAKDTRVYDCNARVNGVLDTKPYSDEANRSWIFRTVGYGHGPEFWTDFISTLSLIGYDGVISIEHEDSLMSVEDGLEKASAFLHQILIRKKLSQMWWA